MEILTADFALNASIVIETMAIFFIIGMVLIFSKVKPGEDGKVESKWDIWLRWSVFASAFIISPTFFFATLLAALIGVFYQGKGKWKLAFALVCIVYAFFK